MHPHHYNDERTKLHDFIIKKTLKGGKPVDKPFAVIIAGGPTAGKSTLIRALRKKGVIPQKGVVTINKDPFAMLPEYSRVANSRHPEKTVNLVDEYWDLLTYIVEEAAKKKIPLVIEEHSEDKVFVESLTRRLKEHGYETALVGMTTTPENYFIHENRRCEAGGKNPDHPWALHCHGRLAEHWNDYIKLFDSSLLTVRNSKGPPLSVIARAAANRDKGTSWQSILDKEFYNDTFKQWKTVNTEAKNPEETFSTEHPTWHRGTDAGRVGQSREGSESRGDEAESAERIDPALPFTERIRKFAADMSAPKR